MIMSMLFLLLLFFCIIMSVSRIFAWIIINIKGKIPVEYFVRRSQKWEIPYVFLYNQEKL